MPLLSGPHSQAMRAAGSSGVEQTRQEVLVGELVWARRGRRRPALASSMAVVVEPGATALAVIAVRARARRPGCGSGR